ncbi:hypothetical protein EVAR_86380_1 [Eumeta japonica]|uniref:Uncharacterized protein n=1 Tax=Eumeta variegata TaxID=151549 RepID=A0A4C1W8V5_EUMVA|nr:hypothetical protein EVAR_86380_1 [Eumeta japonica]
MIDHRRFRGPPSAFEPAGIESGGPRPVNAMRVAVLCGKRARRERHQMRCIRFVSDDLSLPVALDNRIYYSSRPCAAAELLERIKRRRAGRSGGLADLLARYTPR